MLSTGVHHLGRATTQFMAFNGYPVDKDDPQYRANCEAMFRFVKAETDQGRPVVIWGAYVPEFAAAVGTGDDCYYVSSFKEVIKEDQPPVGIYDLDLVHINYALAFPTAGFACREHAGEFAVHRALRLMTQPTEHAKYGWGLGGYDLWAAALRADKADAFGNGYNSKCWHEARHYAAIFIRRMAEKLTERSEHLAKAADHLDRVSAATGEVSKLFPFPPPDKTLSEEVRLAAAEHLMDARAAEEQAIAELKLACGVE